MKKLWSKVRRMGKSTFGILMVAGGIVLFIVVINDLASQTGGQNIFDMLTVNTSRDVQGTPTIDPTAANAAACRASGNIWVNGKCIVPRRSGLK